MYIKEIKNGWTVIIHETKDFKGIATDDRIILFSDEDIDVYGYFEINDNQIIKIHAFYNLKFKVNTIDKVIEFYFIYKA